MVYGRVRNAREWPPRRSRTSERVGRSQTLTVQSYPADTTKPFRNWIARTWRGTIEGRREEGGGEGVMARQLIDLEGKLSLKQIGERLLTRSVWPSTVPPH